MKNRILKFVDHLLHPVDLDDPHQVIKEATRLLENDGNFAEALELLKPVAYSGNALAQTIVGGIFRELKTVPDHNVEAIRWFELAASQGFPLGELNLGIMHLDGLGCQRDLPQAGHWFRQAAQKGHPLAQYELANLIMKDALQGTTVEEAIYWLNLAIKQDFTPAMNELAKMYEQGGLPANKVSALALRRAAAALDDPEAKQVLGQLLYQQSEDLNDEHAFLRLLEESAHYGYAPAQFRLGTIYYNGLGVSSDQHKAASYWSMAAAQGHEDARASLEEIQHVDHDQPKTMENVIPHVPRIG